MRVISGECIRRWLRVCVCTLLGANHLSGYILGTQSSNFTPTPKEYSSYSRPSRIPFIDAFTSSSSNRAFFFPNQNHPCTQKLRFRAEMEKKRVKITKDKAPSESGDAGAFATDCN